MKNMSEDIRKMIDKVNNTKVFLNEEEKWDPFKAITYLIELDILFGGFENTTLKFKMLLPHYENINESYIKNKIDERLKLFTNIVSYDIIKSEEANYSVRILPMY